MPVPLEPVIIKQEFIIFVCIQLVFNCCVSFRSVPKILGVIFGTLFPDVIAGIPHFTSIIRWSQRIGLFLLKKTYLLPYREWICIADHTIQVGFKKALVILRVLPEVLTRSMPLTLKDVEVVTLVVRDKWNSAIIQQEFEKVFEMLGPPVQIVIDGAIDLKKGVINTVANIPKFIKVTYDITHLIARLLKKEYLNNETFKKVYALIGSTRSSIMQS